MLNNFNINLFKSINPSSLGLFRIGFGIILLVHLIDQYRTIDINFMKPQFHFSYPYLEFLNPLPGAGLYLVYWLLILAAAFIILGIFYRTAIISFCVMYFYIFFLDNTYYKNHYYLVLLISFLLSFMNAHACFSLSKKSKSLPVYNWNIWILRFQICVVYFYAGLTKLNMDWFYGEPIRYILQKGIGQQKGTWLGEFFYQEWFISFFAIGGVAYDLMIAFFLINRKTRAWAAFFTIVFHGLNHIVFPNILIFPFLMMTSLIIFFDADWPESVLRSANCVLRKTTNSTPNSQNAVHSTQHAKRSTQYVIRSMLIIYCLIQLLFPLRHWLYSGDIMWTSQGERFSWRMIVKTAVGDLRSIKISDGVTQEEWDFSLYKYHINYRQFATMKTRPEMLLQYIHYLRDQAMKEGVKNPVIHVDHWVSINGRQFQQMIKPDVDLAKINPCNSYANWIYPFNRSLQNLRNR